MTEFHRVTPQFATAGQLTPTDIARAAAEGYRTIVANRPENEEPGQPSLAEMRTAAEAAGLSFHAIPFPASRRLQTPSVRRLTCWRRPKGLSWPIAEPANAQ